MRFDRITSPNSSSGCSDVTDQLELYGRAERLARDLKDEITSLPFFRGDLMGR